MNQKTLFSAVALAALSMTIVLTGCSGGGTPSGNPTPDPGIDRALLLHTWRITSLSKGNTSVTCPGSIGDTSCTAGSVTFNADGTGVASDGFRNTWTLSGSQLSQTTDTPGEVTQSTVSRLTSNELRLVYSDGATITLTR